MLVDEKDKDYEKKLRTLRQEVERVNDNGSKKGANTVEAKRIKELESEIETIKAYYNKRIREIEDKYKFNKPTTDKKLGSKAPVSKEPASKEPKEDTE